MEKTRQKLLMRDAIRKMAQLRFFLFFILLIGPLHAKAQTSFVFDPAIGVRVSIANAQATLSAPNLPGLGSDSTHSLPLAASSTNASIGVEFSNSAALHGTFSGYGYGLSYISPAKKGLRIFFQGMKSEIKGSMTLTSNTGSKAYIRNAVANGHAALGGLGWRFVGSEKSPVALGTFVGPATIAFQSRMELYEASSPDHWFTSTASATGAVYGLQGILRAGPVFVNPYWLKFQSRQKTCTQIETNAPAPPLCIPIDTGFVAYGLNVGYRAFQLNAVSQLKSAPDLHDIKISSYHLSYTLEF